MVAPAPLPLLLLLLLLRPHPVFGDGSVHLTFRNELPDPVSVHWEGPGGVRGGSSDADNRVLQGSVDPSGGELEVQTFPGHTFSYEHGGERHVVTAPDGVDSSMVVLLGGRSGVPVRCATTTGGGQERDQENQELRIRVRPDWSPRGAARFLDLVRIGYYDGAALNRVVPKFLTQFGISADYALRSEWRGKTIMDDPKPSDPPVPFRPGMLSYAGSGPHSRSTEIFVVMPGTPNSQLQYFGVNAWETPFAVVEGDVEDSPVPKWHVYGDMPPWGEGPDSGKIYRKDGYEYLAREFPLLDYIQTCSIADGAEEVEEEL